MTRLFRTVAGLGSNRDAALAAAVQMTSATPARALRLDHVGALRAGLDANLVVLDRDLQTIAVMSGGDWLADSHQDTDQLPAPSPTARTNLAIFLGRLR
jgi:N-acetylglucosamine-6-phosphate deacetylase